MIAADPPQRYWQLLATEAPPNWLVEQVGQRAAQLVWQRGLRSPQAVTAFCDPQHYSPTPPWAFAEMNLAVQRLLEARQLQERVAIWGDFDADGVTATAVLWEGLGQFFDRDRLSFYIPNRLTESHGVSVAGIERLQADGISLIVTCDTGSTSLAAIARANELGIDVIITDHHTLPPERPPVVAMLNPRDFPTDHPLATLSGVAVAYKLIEALYLSEPDIPEQPLETLLDLVAIGLVADLVELRGDVRYLAQQGIERLKQKARPAVQLLLEQCKRAGDRAMDIAFGLGPRINAVSRVHGDASFCVEMLTEGDRELAKTYVAQTELANTRRKGIQAEVLRQARERLQHSDFSTDVAIVLASADWPAGVLGIVAGQLAREYHRPAFVFRVEGDRASGSARSVAGIDLYQLLQQHETVIDNFGGHPLAAGLRLPAENLPLLQQRLNHTLRQWFPTGFPTAQLAIDLELTVSDLGQELFRELNQLEPFGMGNPVPKLLLRGARFDAGRNRNSRDAKGQTVRYIYTTFRLSDRTDSIRGIWWGHYSYELPQGLCDAVVELDYMGTQRDRASSFDYQVRLIDVRAAVSSTDRPLYQFHPIDLRGKPEPDIQAQLAAISEPVILGTCPVNWTEVFSRALPQRPFVLAYREPLQRSPQQAWSTLVGWAKSLAASGTAASRQRWIEALQVSARTFGLGLVALESAGFGVEAEGDRFSVSANGRSVGDVEAIERFQAAVAEEEFQRRYFYETDVEAIAAVLNHPAGRSRVEEAVERSA